ncbi:hypothetical protein [Crucian carp herpesvirus]|uniref:ORF10A n=1 Tax=Cyprinid herpesvirus 2 TaxID=317878 RepID=A0A0E3T5E0_CYHV2|nr:hypothetical protein [Cyprinid herpesvirus 2]AMB21588.1 ORF10A [Cyprinid herpesvirus 2]APB92869.1 hypothetical protein [Crucian carp herpesvirus]QIM55167.1 hypothetical protein [Cyprinid herpesvirus 2]
MFSYAVLTVLIATGAFASDGARPSVPTTTKPTMKPAMTETMKQTIKPMTETMKTMKPETETMKQTMKPMTETMKPTMKPETMKPETAEKTVKPTLETIDSNRPAYRPTMSEAERVTGISVTRGSVPTTGEKQQIKYTGQGYTILVDKPSATTAKPATVKPTRPVTATIPRSLEEMLYVVMKANMQTAQTACWQLFHNATVTAATNAAASSTETKPAV